MTRYTNLAKRKVCKEGATSWAALKAQRTKEERGAAATPRLGRPHPPQKPKPPRRHLLINDRGRTPLCGLLPRKESAASANMKRSNLTYTAKDKARTLSKEKEAPWLRQGSLGPLPRAAHLRPPWDGKRQPTNQERAQRGKERRRSSRSDHYAATSLRLVESMTLHIPTRSSGDITHINARRHSHRSDTAIPDMAPEGKYVRLCRVEGRRAGQARDISIGDCLMRPSSMPASQVSVHV